MKESDSPSSIIESLTLSEKDRIQEALIDAVKAEVKR